MPYDHPKPFSLSPYFDDYDENKQFLRTLFRPGHAVQGRELTQLQTILQTQVSRVGDHLFEDGSQVFGGQVTDQEVKYIRLNKSYASTSDFNAGQSIDASILIGGEVKIKDATDDTALIRANIIHAEDVYGTNDDYIILYINYTEGDGEFTEESTLQINQTGYSDWAIHVVHKSARVDNDDWVAANGTARVITVDEGIFYVNGFFVKNLRQIIALHRISESNQTEDYQLLGDTVSPGAPSGVRLLAKPDARVGLDVTGQIVGASDDPSLYDPASGTYNYNAPGADRYKINPVLTQIELTPTSESAVNVSRDGFIELVRVVYGEVNKLIKYTDYAVLEDTLARRTYDESGSYTVRPFEVDVRDYLREDKHVLTGVLNTTQFQGYNPFEILVEGTSVSQTGDFSAEFKVAYLEQDDNPITGESKFKLYIVKTLGTVSTTGNFKFSEGQSSADFPDILKGVTIFDGNPSLSFAVDQDGAFEESQIVSGVEDFDSILGLGLENGKAYIFGYEFETQGTKFIRYDKPRKGDSEYNGSMDTNIGNFVRIRTEVLDGAEVFGTNNFGEDPSNVMPYWPTHSLFSIGNINNALSDDDELWNLPKVYVTVNIQHWSGLSEMLRPQKELFIIGLHFQTNNIAQTP